MFDVVSKSWALLLGMFMLMIGNGLQGTLLGVRGSYEGFSTLSISLIMSAYFLGFLFASRAVPELIRRVGHVRVFAALGSTISAVLILYPALVTPWAWMIGRVVIGFCFCGVYVTAESWLNNDVSNENRGKALSIYMIVQLAGIVFAQYLLTLADVQGYILFIIPSVLVSLAFAPILLSIRPTPAFETTKPLSLKRLIEASPLACAGMFILGAVYAAQFGMSAVYGTRVGLSISQISLMVSVIYVTALVLQYPIGWLSDRMDRRILIIALSTFGGLGALLPILVPGYYALLIGAAVLGGASNPLYALCLAYANDNLDQEDMAAASGGLLFVNGVAAVSGPLLIGWLMDFVGPVGFWMFLVICLFGLTAFGLWRMLRRPKITSVEDTISYAPIAAGATPVVMEVAQEIYIETENDELSEN